MARSLPTAVLGRTGLEVTRLGYGTALDHKEPDDEQWGGLLNRVLDSGINFIRHGKRLPRRFPERLVRREDRPSHQVPAI